MLGGGAGAVLAMIESYKNNAALRRKKSILKRDRSPFAAQMRLLKPSKGYISTRPLTQEQLDEIKARYDKVHRASRVRTITAGAIVLFLIAGLVLVSVFAFDNIARGLTTEEIRAEHYKKKRFAFFMNDGDRYLGENEWHNAQFQYNEARQLFPANFDAQYRYCLAMFNSCRYEQTNCEQLDQLVKELLKKYPENALVQDLADARLKMLGDAADTPEE